jgi:pyruvate dehydrogenase E1 component beta subunit
MNKKSITYGEALFEAMDYLLLKYPEFFIIGQGLWSPWYVGDTMTGLEKKYGKKRIIDTPVSENGTTGAAMGAALAGLRPLVVHPRMDFMILASDAIVNQAAKWQSMLGGEKKIPLTIRAIINRGGEQGAQHSQALHSWYAHIPGLRVVMPYDPLDARDLLIASVLNNDPVIFIDDRWCYHNSVPYEKINILNLKKIGPKHINLGNDLTLVGAGYSTSLCKDVCEILKKQNLNADVFDMRVINPLDISPIVDSVKNTQKLFVIDGGWQSCGLGGEIIASVIEKSKVQSLVCNRFSTENAPAPSSKVLEKSFYQNPEIISRKIMQYFS